MPTVIFIQPDGATETIDAAVGETVMHAAVTNGVPGILAECGGACSCATCHVYVDDAWVGRLDPISEDEEEMLECTASERGPNSRLSCQIELSPALDGLVVRTPPTQS